MKLLRVLYCHNIPNVFHHAQLPVVPGRVRADRANSVVSHIVTNTAETYAMTHSGNCAGKFIYFFYIHFQQLQHHTDRRFPSNAG
jgi:hypothetical protein